MSNVLVYAGPGVSISALQHTLRTLRQLLSLYDVQVVTAKSLALDPWEGSTSLVVIPGGRDLPYVEQLGESHPLASNSTTDNRTSRADERVRRYVEAGGAYLGICAGAYFASSHCAFEKGTPMEVDGPRPALQFYPGVCQGAVYPGFVYESDAGARLVRLRDDHSTEVGSREWSCHYNGGGAFMQADSYGHAGVTVLARYSGQDPVQSANPTYANQAAAVCCQAGKGKALLYGVHPEFPILPDSRPVQLSGASHTLPQGSPGNSSDNKLRSDDYIRLRAMGSHLRALGLTVDIPDASDDIARPDKAPAKIDSAIVGPPKLTPLVLVASDPTATWAIVQALRNIKAPSQIRSFAELSDIDDSAILLSTGDSNDHFHIFSGNVEVATAVAAACAKASYDPFRTTPHPGSALQDKHNDDQEEPEVDLHLVPKCVLVYPPTQPASGHMTSNTFPDALTLTPHFDSELYLKALSSSRKILSESMPLNSFLGALPFMKSENVVIGDPFLYAQMVTSTQTMLDRNFKVLSRLPSGLTAFATHQASGRGRGGNTWISPLGCLQFSTILRLPASLAPRVVFVQYLAGLAIVEAVRSGLGPEYRAVGERIRIKWPNDVYAEVDDEYSQPADQEGSTNERKGTFVVQGKRYAKMAGVLVNSQFAGQEFLLVVGCGINCTNARPTTSLSDLIASHNAAASIAGGTRLAPVSQERLAGAILATLENMWHTFVGAGSFEPFTEKYCRIWLHSDQSVILQDTVPPTPVRIVGIASDYGTLRAVPVSSNINTYSQGAWGESGRSSSATITQHGDFIDLQPDGNSFDMLQNLIRKK